MDDDSSSTVFIEAGESGEAILVVSVKIAQSIVNNTNNNTMESHCKGGKWGQAQTLERVTWVCACTVQI